MKINDREIRTVWWEEGKIQTINQLLLPDKFEIVSIDSEIEVVNAIRNMIVRGAPAIGAMGAYGLALALRNMDEFNLEDLKASYTVLLTARPTAYDLADGLNWVMRAVDDEKSQNIESVRKKALEAAQAYADKSVEACRLIGINGKDLIRNGMGVLTHCNAGALATVDHGTALAPIRQAHREGRKFFVFVDETRPRLQGTMLTAWELCNEGIDHAVIADNAAGYYFEKGRIDILITGADRIARNGDIANKIGTYEKAVLAHYHDIPFYVAAPFTTIDFSCEDGTMIPIEERPEDEVLEIREKRIAPTGSSALNPAFDITPAGLVTGIITELGIIQPEELNQWENRNA